MFKATKLIAEAFDAKGLKYNTKENGELSLINVSMNNKSGSDEQYYFVSDDEKNDILIRSGTIARIPAEKTDAALELVNSFNTRFRFARFYLDKDNDVIAQVDVPVETQDADVGKIAIEMLVRLSKMYDDVYPQLMKCIWN